MQMKCSVCGSKNITILPRYVREDFEVYICEDCLHEWREGEE